MHNAKPRAGNVKWFEERRRKGKRSKASPQQIVSLRLNEFAILFRARYGTTLPDDDAGRDDIEPVIHHLAALSQAARRADHWLDLWAPWLTLGERRKIIADGIANARAWKADQLAWRYRITREEREMLGLTTIGAIDQGKAARTKRRRDRDLQRKREARRAKGAMPRTDYESKSLARAQPWKAEGISRTEWYRRRAARLGTGPATA